LLRNSMPPFRGAISKACPWIFFFRGQISAAACRSTAARAACTSSRANAGGKGGSSRVQQRTERPAGGVSPIPHALEREVVARLHSFAAGDIQRCLSNAGMIHTSPVGSHKGP
jgi:hypothetical protein